MRFECPETGSINKEIYNNVTLRIKVNRIQNGWTNETQQQCSFSYEANGLFKVEA